MRTMTYEEWKRRSRDSKQTVLVNGRRVRRALFLDDVTGATVLEEVMLVHTNKED